MVLAGFFLVSAVVLVVALIVWDPGYNRDA